MEYRRERTAASEPPTSWFRLDGEDSRVRAGRAAVHDAIG
jgi:hypothetical protein